MLQHRGLVGREICRQRIEKVHHGTDVERASETTVGMWLLGFVPGISKEVKCCENQEALAFGHSGKTPFHRGLHAYQVRLGSIAIPTRSRILSENPLLPREDYWTPSMQSLESPDHHSL